MKEGTVMDTFTNRIGQTFDLVEHPTKGDFAPIVIVYHEKECAVYSTFYDLDDLTNDSYGDYHPVYMYDGICLGFEAEYPLY